MTPEQLRHEADTATDPVGMSHSMMVAADEIERLEKALSTANDRGFAAGVQFAQRLLERLNIRRGLYDGATADAYRIAEELLREEMAKMEDTDG